MQLVVFTSITATLDKKPFAPHCQRNNHDLSRPVFKNPGRQFFLVNLGISGDDCLICCFQVLDECGKSLRTLNDNEYTFASTAVSTNTTLCILLVP